MDFVYSSYCFHRLKMLPSEYAKLKGNEKVLVIAFIEMQLEKEEKERNKLKNIK